MEITGFDHVQLAMPAGEEETARRFYSGLLGLKEVPKPARLAGRGGCWFEGRDVVIHLGVAAPFRPVQKAHPAFRVADLAAAAATLKAAGVAVTVDDNWPGVPRFYTRDPFGNRLEFIQGP